MKPVITLVGRPNVGKSTLFNRLTHSRAALVADLPGLTRDRIYGDGKLGDRPYMVVDTGGLSSDKKDGDHSIADLMAGQARQAMQEADAILFLVDGRGGLIAGDKQIAAYMRQMGKRIYVVVNKSEGVDPNIVTAEFQSLGLGQPYAISAAHGDGVAGLMEAVLAALPDVSAEKVGEEEGIKVAVVGRPNVGKSTLINRMLGEDRVLVFDQAGTTRDSIYIPYERDDQRYVLIDTAGVRRRARVEDTIEKFSIIKTLQAIDAAHVVIMVLDAREGVNAQDLTLAGMVVERGRALVMAINKWDGLSPDQRQQMKTDIDRRLPFLDFAEMYFVSALHGSGVGDLFDAVISAFGAAMRKFATPELTRMLNDAVTHYPPPLVKGRRIKLRYAHQGGSNPPLIIIHGNQTAAVPAAYQRYLINTFRTKFRLKGTPMRIEFKTGANPYAGKKNVLTKRQTAKRKRLKRHIKRS
jgi:GTP-binding protein